jgi:hypothetical protein
MNIISFSILLCLTFRNCTTLAICSYVIYYNYVIVTCYSYAARNMEVEDAVKKKIIDYCYIENNKVKLKDNHNYMYQIQGLLEITNRECCYFFIYTFKDYNCEIIKRNKQFWENQMVGKLERFYSSAYLFELLDSRYNRNMAIRDIKCKDL